MKAESNNNFPRLKYTYKVKPLQQGRDGIGNSRGQNSYRFLSLRVKPQIYKGYSRVALFVNDKTKKVAKKLDYMQQQESFLSAQQAEGYTSLIKHELDVPLGTCIHFLAVIADLLRRFIT